ncbi:hypothetical protein [Brevibacillus sp. SKDU10]|uniref:hypothetical protein n=1 Tax=Brevibacillus sp. SKDU10 TaxID=1247872 RepID=UPI001E3FAE2D|nr:hypothetical protein [Brevibacillus sp. SKDU10]
MGKSSNQIIKTILDASLSIKEGGIKVWKKGFVWHFGPLLVRAAKYYGIPFREEDLHTPIGELVKQALALFSKMDKIKQKLVYLDKIGLGYIKLGQPANTLSGGEAQRIKLASELATAAGRNTPVYFR